MAQIGATPTAPAPAPAAGDVAAAPVGRSFDFQPLPNPTAGATGAEGPIPPVRGDAAAADATIGTPTGERAAPPAEVAAQANIGTTPATQTLENAGDVAAAVVGGQEATVKGKVERFDEQARTVTLDNGDAYVLADNLKVGEGALTADMLQAGNDIQLVYRTDAERKIVVSLTDLPDSAGAAGAGMPVPATN